MKRSKSEKEMEEWIGVGLGRKSESFRKFGYGGVNGTTFNGLLAAVNGHFWMWGMKKPKAVPAASRKMIRKLLIDVVNWYATVTPRELARCRKAHAKHLESIWGAGAHADMNCRLGKNGKIEIEKGGTFVSAEDIIGHKLRPSR